MSPLVPVRSVARRYVALGWHACVLLPTEGIRHQETRELRRELLSVFVHLGTFVSLHVPIKSLIGAKHAVLAYQARWSVESIPAASRHSLKISRRLTA